MFLTGTQQFAAKSGLHENYWETQANTSLMKLGNCMYRDRSQPLRKQNYSFDVKERLRTVFFCALKSVNLRKRTVLLHLGMKPPKNASPKKPSRQKMLISNVRT